MTVVSEVRWHILPRAALVAGLLLAVGCSGPQPLSVAIRPTDEAAYAEALRQNPASPKAAFFQWKSAATGQSAAELIRLDEALSTTSNPFSARRDADAVSRGAVIYKAHCASCHGESADGRGPAMQTELPDLNFHAFSKRFAVTLHGGAPRTWFQKISEGFTSETVTANGTPITMPAMRDVLSREQIWLSITYLQSLDADAHSMAER